MRLNTDPIIFSGNISISDNLTISLVAEDFDINIKNITDSHIGNTIINWEQKVISAI